MLLRECQIQKLIKPTLRNHINLFNYIWNEKPVYNEEFDFVLHKDDLVTLEEASEHSWLDEFVQGILDRLPMWISRVR
jgi:hypothetical protein